MLTSELDYPLPPELIAQHPAVPRGSGRLLVFRREQGEIRHRRLPGLLSYLRAGDVLVYNDSRVIPARLRLRRASGGRVELLFLRRRGPALWEALARPSARLREDEGLAFSAGSAAASGGAGSSFRLRELLGKGRWLVENLTGVPTTELLEAAGEMPLPPYIKEKPKDPDHYQTVYAHEPGSAAAPTAGLHFTPGLIRRIGSLGVGLHPVTLHIGLDTFRPVDEEELKSHRIHSEGYRMPPGTYEAVRNARNRGGRVLAVGTTSVRVLETVFGSPPGPLQGETSLFIVPGHEFRAVDALLTNFHLPRSTLLALVMSFAGVTETRQLYREAINARYRFYSFGDAMLVL